MTHAASSSPTPPLDVTEDVTRVTLERITQALVSAESLVGEGPEYREAVERLREARDALRAGRRRTRAGRR